MLIAADHPVDVADDAPLGETPGLTEALQAISGRTLKGNVSSDFGVSACTAGSDVK